MTQQIDEQAGGKSGRRIDLNPTQAAASGLAAVTVAILGSGFGWAGSVLGAGLASVITTLASALYQQTLDRTKESVKEKVVARTAPVARERNRPQPPGTRMQPPGPMRGDLAPGQRHPAQGNPMPPNPMQRPPAGTPLAPPPGGRQVPGTPGPARPGQQPPPGSGGTERPRWPGQEMDQPTTAQPTAAQPPTTAQSQRTEVNLGDQEAKTFTAIDPTTILANQQTRVVRPVGQPGPTQAIPGQPGQPPTQRIAAQHGQPPNDPGNTQVIGQPEKGKRKLRWPLIVGVSAAAFLFGLLVLTGLEAIKGGSLIGDNPGTSIGRMGGYTPAPQPDSGDEQPAGDTPTEDSPTGPTEGSTAPTEESETPPTEQSEQEQAPEEQPEQPAEPPQQQPEQPPGPQGGQAPAEPPDTP